MVRDPQALYDAGCQIDCLFLVELIIYGYPRIVRARPACPRAGACAAGDLRGAAGVAQAAAGAGHVVGP